MPLFTLPNPQGLDYYVQRQQSRLFPFLLNKWGIDDATFNSFGRAYRNYTQDGYIPQFYKPAEVNESADYVGSNAVNGGPIFYNDTLSVVSFYGLGDPEAKNNIRDEVAKVQLMLFVDLSKITPGGILVADQGGQRLDEVAINDVKNFLECNGCCFTMTNTYRDIDKVLERYSGSLKRQALEDNMHPKLCFRIDMEIRYNPQMNVTT